MTEDSGPSANTLADLVKELNNAILALRTLIEREYPNRREIEAQFVRKRDSDARLKLVLVLVVITTLCSFGATVGTMSACYVSDVRPGFCNMIPNYGELEKRRERNDRLINRIEKLEKGQP